MNHAEDVLPARVPIVCWRCGDDAGAAFDLIRIRGRNVAVHKVGNPACVPTLVKETS